MSHEDVRKPSAEYLETNGEAFEAHQAALASQYQPGTEEERKLVWKIDKRIVVSDPDQFSGGDKPNPADPLSAMHLDPLHHVIPGPRQHR
jgi:hypothetical protein